MNLKRAVGTTTKVGEATLFLQNFVEYQGQALAGTGWQIWSNVGPLHRLQNLMIEQHGKALEQMQKIRENADLTREAKKRRAAAVFETFTTIIKPALPAIQETAQNLYTYASTKMQPVVPLGSGDAVGAALDAECRAYTHDLPKEQRMQLIVNMSRGQDLRIAAAVLRGPARISGYTDDQVIRLGAAGIATAYPEAVITLGKLVVGVREVLMNAHSLGLDIIRAGVGIDSLSTELQNWVSPGDGYAKLVAWLEPIPLELPSGPLPQEVAKALAKDDDGQAADAA
jgi:hypothetical protein